MTARSTARTGLAAMVAVVVVGTAACTDETDAFCDRLGDTLQMTELRRAINRDDEGAIEAALEELQRLEDVAPTEIEDEVGRVVDAVIDAVRVVTRVDGPDGRTSPVDLTALNAALDAIAPDAQAVLAYADETCDIPPSTTR